MSFLFAYPITSLKEEVEKLIPKIPIIGEKSGEFVVCLAHYSRNECIQCFEPRSNICVWTTMISSKLDTIYNMTSDMSPEQYNALYIIRMRMKSKHQTSDLVPMIGMPKAGTEYALNLKIMESEFGKVLLAYDKSGGFLVPR